jgi:hypothetical protein
MYKKMMRSALIAFVVGFLVYAAIPVAMDQVYTPELIEEPLWGLRFSILWGGVGGIAFVVSWLCIVGLWGVMKNLVGKQYL